MEQQPFLEGEPPWWQASTHGATGRTIIHAREKRKQHEGPSRRQHSSFDLEPPEYTKYLNGVPAALRGSDGVYRRLHEHLPAPAPAPDWSPGRKPRPASLRLFLFSMGVLSLLLMMYIPAYKQANSRRDTHASRKDLLHSLVEKFIANSLKGSVAGWSYNTSRDTRSYVLPDNVTLLNQPRSICRPPKQRLPSIKGSMLQRHSTPGPPDKESEEIFLLVIVCSSMNHFKARAAIRNSWGSQSNYEQLSERIFSVADVFSKINLTEKMVNDFPDLVNITAGERRIKRDLEGVEYEDDGVIDVLPDLDGSILNYINATIYDGFNMTPLEDSRLNVNSSLNINDSFYDYVKDSESKSDKEREESKYRQFVKYESEKSANSIIKTIRTRKPRSIQKRSVSDKKASEPTAPREEGISDDVDDPRFDHGDAKTSKITTPYFKLETEDINSIPDYDYQTEISNIMRIPKRGEVSSIENNDMENAIDNAKDLLKVSIKDNKLNLAFHKSDAREGSVPVETKPPSKFVDTNIITNVKKNEVKPNTNSKIHSTKDIYKDVKEEDDPLLIGPSYTEFMSSYANQKIHNSKSNVDSKSDKPWRNFVRTKYLFILGQSTNDNDTELQTRIDEEAATHGDIIQEGFIDSYNNLTLKSVMLLKWVVTNCNKKVRYVLKTDDDIFINIPQLVEALQNKSQEFENQNKLAQHVKHKSEILLMGDLICGARPIADTSSKWYSPTYMFDGKVYPRYLSGTSYVMSYAAVAALYNAALDTPLFHLEDIYITGMVSRRVGIKPIDHPGFSFWLRSLSPCVYSQLITAHRVTPAQLVNMSHALLHPGTLESCSVQRLIAKKESLLTRTKKLFSGILASPRSLSEAKKRKVRTNIGCA